MALRARVGPLTPEPSCNLWGFRPVQAPRVLSIRTNEYLSKLRYSLQARYFYLAVTF